MHSKLLFCHLIFFIFFFIQRTGCRKYYTGAIPPGNESTLSRRWYYAIFHDLEQNVPEEFDARQKWPHCKSIQQLVDQGSCGSCWAVASATTLTDRACVAGKDFEYSVEDILTCCTDCSMARRKKTKNISNPCVGGGLLTDAFHLWIGDGVVSGGEYNSQRGCKPYSCDISPACNPPECQKACTNSNYTKSYQKDKQLGRRIRYSLKPKDLRHVQLEIMKNGPVICSMRTSDHFMFEYDRSKISDFKNEIYRHPYEEKPNGGYHQLKVIGWGAANGQKYWLVANSWGKDWGLEGFGKLPRGENFQELENEFAAAYYDGDDGDDDNRNSSESLTISHLYMFLCCLIALYVF